jgi:hypothetical protein
MSGWIAMGPAGTKGYLHAAFDDNNHAFGWFLHAGRIEKEKNLKDPHTRRILMRAKIKTHSRCTLIEEWIG